MIFDTRLIFFFLFSILFLASDATQSQTLSLEEKVGQLLMVNFNGEIANAEAKALIQESKVGGIIYYKWANGLHCPEQIRELSSSLQNLTEIPLLIATDQEGGLVCRATNGFTIFPGNKALGMTQDPNLAEAAALSTGLELLSVGINMNLAPVIDVNANPRNPVIGIRSFGDMPETVVAFGEKVLNGYAQANIIATLKHYPGHGDVEVDSHEDLPVIHKTLDALEELELLPFAKLAANADAIMTAHILVPAFDKEYCSTLSEKTLSYLRNKIGFQGVIISDSLVMEGVLKTCSSVDEAAVLALNAGCDILLLGGKLLTGENKRKELTACDIQRIHASVVQAVKEGRISEKRVTDASEKILALKRKYLPSKKAALNQEFHAAISKKIATLALQIIPNKSAPIPSLQQKNVFIFAPQLLLESIQKTSLLTTGKITNSYFFSTLNPNDEEICTAKQLAADAEVIVACSYNAWENPSQEALIQSLLDTGKPVILITMRDPLDALLFPKSHLIINTFSPTAVSIQAVSDQLKTY